MQRVQVQEAHVRVCELAVASTSIEMATAGSTAGSRASGECIGSG